MTATTVSKKGNMGLNVSLWVAQILLALFYGAVGAMTSTQPISMLADTLFWAAMLPENFVRFIGLMELCGAMGLVLPMLTRIGLRLTLSAAVCLGLLQIFAIVWHCSQGEFLMLPLNIALLAVSLFIAEGRRATLAQEMFNDIKEDVQAYIYEVIHDQMRRSIASQYTSQNNNDFQAPPTPQEAPNYMDNVDYINNRHAGYDNDDTLPLKRLRNAKIA